MKILLNGEEHVVPPGTSVQSLVESRPTGIAVALDGEVVARSQWASTSVEDGSVIEIVTAVQGG